MLRNKNSDRGLCCRIVYPSPYPVPVTMYSNSNKYVIVIRLINRCKFLSDHQEFIQSDLLSISSIVLTCMHASGFGMMPTKSCWFPNHADFSERMSLMRVSFSRLASTIYTFLFHARKTRTEITWDVHSVATALSWYFLFFLKFRLPIWLHSSCSIS